VQGYWNYMDRVKQYGDAFTDGDKLALRDAESGELPNLCLLKARLLYDGGYFAQADSTLNRLDCGLTTERDKTEFPYRRGRISHALNDIDAALSWYEKTIETGGRQPYYFASNAALQIGAIYESLGDYSLAEDYYRQCLQMPGKEYKTSLNQKAKAGLNSLKDKNTTK
ncbi:MAG: tetratricopeptide repeat protein, partial [Bacteroidota bacterium]